MIPSKLRTAIVTVIALTWASAANAGGGWYHMPTDFFQCMGWGFGPGYHADLVLARGHHFVMTPHRVVRVPVAPFAVGVGCHGCDTCGMSQLPGCEFAPLPYAEPVPADATQTTSPPVEQIAAPLATAPARTLPPLFPPPPILAPVR